MLRPKNLWQHGVGILRRQRPLVAPFVLSQVLAFVERYGDIALRLNQQIVLREEAGKQHAVPVFTSSLLHQMLNSMLSRACWDGPKLASVRPQPLAQRALLHVHVSVELAAMHGKFL